MRAMQGRRWFSAALLFLTCATPPPPPPPAKIDFKEELRRHGEWILVSPYGKLWHPNTREVGKDFVPYLTGGQWVRTSSGWSFASKWAWGDLVFHHGRWMWTQDYDWLWSLDEAEAPSFVSWRVGSEYIGWAPLAPLPPRQNLPPPDEKWVYVKARVFAQDEIEKYKLSYDESMKAKGLTEPLPGSFGPALEFVAGNNGLVQEADGGYRVPDVPPPAPEPVVEQQAPESKVEVELAKPPAPEPKKTTKGKKKAKKK